MPQGIYILHYFAETTIGKRYGGPFHYVGLSQDIVKRIKRHQSGWGSVPTTRTHKQGIPFKAYAFAMPATIENETYVTRRVLEYCPKCESTEGEPEFRFQWTEALNRKQSCAETPNYQA